jgi:hypothetical protein
MGPAEGRWTQTPIDLAVEDLLLLDHSALPPPSADGQPGSINAPGPEVDTCLSRRHFLNGMFFNFHSY